MDVPDAFYTIKDEWGNTYIYPQGDKSVPPSGKMPKDGYFFDNITRGNIIFDEDTNTVAEDFKNDFRVIIDEQLRELERLCNYYYDHTGSMSFS